MNVVDRLDAFLAISAAPTPELITLRALTLHLFLGVAPLQFERRGLSAVLRAALAACEAVDFGFDGPLDADRAQAGIDAWYLRRLHGLTHPAPDRTRLAQLLRALEDDGQPNYTWLLAELARRSGVETDVTVDPRIFKSHRLAEGYYLTHLPMVATDYFRRPLVHPEAGSWADAIADLVPWLERKPNLDLAGEVLLCLRVMKRDARAALALVEPAALSDDPHTQATTLVALAVE